MFDQVVEIICEYTEVPKEEIRMETNLLSDLGLESMDFVDMVCDFEEAFGQEVPERDFRKLVTVSSIISYIEERSK